MKYSEYQVWYHVYTKASQAILRADKDDNFTYEDVIRKASAIADHALGIFKTVDDKPAMPNSLNIQGLVDQVIKDSGKKKNDH